MAKKLPPEILEFFVNQGRKGGKLGGPARAEKMTKAQRSASARKAVNARWEKERARKAKLGV